MPRPRSPLLSVDAIVGTALSLVDAFGNFSFPKVAKELGVSQSALYSYIENRAHIIELMRGPVLSSRHPLNMEDLSWEDALRTLAHGYRERLLEHPRLVPHLVTQTVRDLGVMGIYEDMVIVLGKAGLAGSAVVPAITTVDYLVPGSALELAAPEVVWSPAKRVSRAFCGYRQRASPSRSSRTSGTKVALLSQPVISGRRIQGPNVQKPLSEASSAAARFLYCFGWQGTSLGPGASRLSPVSGGHGLRPSRQSHWISGPAHRFLSPQIPGFPNRRPERQSGWGPSEESPQVPAAMVINHCRPGTRRSRTGLSVPSQRTALVYRTPQGRRRGVRQEVQPPPGGRGRPGVRRSGR